MDNRKESYNNEGVKKLEDWSNEERFNLLQALQKHGSQDIARLHTYVRTKSQEQIEAALEFYIEKSLSIAAPKEPRKRRGSKPPIEALDSWAQLLAEAHNPEELQTEIANALRLIAEFEDKPSVACTENVDFDKIYHMLADAVEGKPLQEDSLVKAMIDKCVTDTALTSEYSIRNTKIKDLLGSISLTEKVGNTFPRPTDEKDLANLRPLIAERNYNPLNISEENCKLLG